MTSTHTTGTGLLGSKKVNRVGHTLDGKVMVVFFTDDSYVKFDAKTLLRVAF